MVTLAKKEEKIFKKLSSPKKIQDFLNTIIYNFEEDGETCRSPRNVLLTRKAHCLEGALFAAAVLWYHGEKPYLLDLRSTKDDLDHVVALFKKNGYWGAISKTNHAVLRYREPIYKTIRELSLSYFHEYFLQKNGKKTLREYSNAFNLSRFGDRWITESEDLWDIGAALDDAPHTAILPTSFTTHDLRPADAIEIKAGALLEQVKEN